MDKKISLTTSPIMVLVPGHIIQCKKIQNRQLKIKHKNLQQNWVVLFQKYSKFGDFCGAQTLKILYTTQYWYPSLFKRLGRLGSMNYYGWGIQCDRNDLPSLPIRRLPISWAFAESGQSLDYKGMMWHFPSLELLCVVFICTLGAKYKKKLSDWALELPPLPFQFWLGVISNMHLVINVVSFIQNLPN